MHLISHTVNSELLDPSPLGFYSVSQHTMRIFDRDYVTPRMSSLYFNKIKKNTHPCLFYLCEFFLNNGDIKP